MLEQLWREDCPELGKGGMKGMRTKPTREQDRIIKHVIEVLGLSYEDAVRWCEREAYSASKPYLQAAGEIKGWLARSATKGTDDV